jgi:Undecaprenyl-phosphate glucose phosphotransferase
LQSTGDQRRLKWDRSFVTQKKISMGTLAGIVCVLDCALLLIAAWLAAIVDEAWREAPLHDLLPLIVIGVGTGCIFLASQEAYSFVRLRTRRSQIWLVLKTAALVTAIVIVCPVLVGSEAPQMRAFPLAFGANAFLLLAGLRLSLHALILRWTRAGRFRRRIAIVAVNDFSQEFIKRLMTEPEAFEIVGVYDDRLRRGRVPSVHVNVQVRGSIADLVIDSREERIDVIAVALPLSAVQRISVILEELSSTVADVCLTTDLAGFAYRDDQFGSVGSNRVITVGENPLKDWRAVKKAGFDYVAGAIAVVISLPVFAVIALAIRLDSKGPILFVQPRIGFNNRKFNCYKFRTMYADMTDVMADRQTTRGDPRITRVGKWLRKFSLDELPQLLNVMNGSMSLVGPRPHAPNTKAADRLFNEVVQQYALRHRVKPGITGWAQVNGWRGETTTEEHIKNRVRYDLFYIDNWSLHFDIKIACLTILREIHSQHAF